MSEASKSVTIAKAAETKGLEGPLPNPPRPTPRPLDPPSGEDTGVSLLFDVRGSFF
jgi:hypothetical protein